MHPIRRAKLKNGLRMVLVPLNHLHTATISILVRAGSRYETPSTNGLSHFLEHMLFRGTESHPTAYDLNLAMESIGGTLHGSTHVDFTMYQVTLPRESVFEGLMLMSEIIMSPTFHNLSVEKGILKEEILEELDEEGRDIDVDNIARDVIFSPHPLGLKITGSPDNVARFGIRELKAHMDRHYSAHNMVLSIAGAFKPTPIRKAIREAFSELAPGGVTHGEQPQQLGTEQYRHVTSHGSQTDLRVSFPTFGVCDDRFPALQILTRVLDDGMSTRLHRRICDEKGLAYDVFAAIDPYEDCGVFDFGASVAHDKAPALVRELLELCVELTDDLVSEAELEKAKRRTLFDLQATLDDGAAIASYYGTNTLFGLDYTLETGAEAVKGVNRTAVREVARAILLPSTARISSVGMLDQDLQEAVKAERAVYDE